MTQQQKSIYDSNMKKAMLLMNDFSNAGKSTTASMARSIQNTLYRLRNDLQKDKGNDVYISKIDGMNDLLSDYAKDLTKLQQSLNFYARKSGQLVD